MRPEMQGGGWPGKGKGCHAPVNPRSLEAVRSFHRPIHKLQTKPKFHDEMNHDCRDMIQP